MIFGSIIKRAENAFENILDQALARLFIALPFLVALGFATASASVFLNEKYGSQWGNLILAGAFATLGFIAAIIVSARSDTGPRGTPAEGKEEAVAQAAPSTAEDQAQPLTGSERELMNSLLASAAPIAIPGLVRLLLRNIPLLIALVAAIFVLTRPDLAEAPAPAAEEPLS